MPLRPEKLHDFESIINYVRQDCPFKLNNDARIVINKRKIYEEPGLYTGVIYNGDTIIKFSTEDIFSNEMEKNRVLNKVFIKLRLHIRLPQLFSFRKGKISGEKINYAKSKRYKETDLTIYPAKYVKSLVKSLRELKSVPVEELDQRLFKTKTKLDYFHEVNEMLEFASKSLLASDEETINYFEERKEAALRLYSQESVYDAEESLIHGDFTNNNVLIDGAGRIKIIDWEKSCIGIAWEDYAICFYNLIIKGFKKNQEDQLIDALTEKRYPNKNVAEHMWDQLNSKEKYHTMLFIIYKSLFLLKHHMEHFKRDQKEESKNKVIRNINIFFTAVEYCRQNPDHENQSKAYPFQDEVLASFFLNNLP